MMPTKATKGESSGCRFNRHLLSYETTTGARVRSVKEMETERRKPTLSPALALAAVALALCAPAYAAPKYQVLHSFNGTDGSGPYGGVTFGPQGDLYGTTAGGGPCGTVFGLSPQKSDQWEEIVLYQFGIDKDGCDPWSGVTFDPAGNLYGTTIGGGGGAYDSGTVFELSPGSTGWTEKVLFAFDFNDGAKPVAGVALDDSGNLYGTTPGGGSTVAERRSS